MASQHHPSPHVEKDSEKPRSKDEESLFERASDTVRDASDQASKLAEKAVEQGRELGDMARRAPSSLRETVDSSLKQQPMATLAAAAALGFVLGALWRS